MNFKSIILEWVRNTQMNDVAEANKYVVIYPQTAYVNITKNLTNSGCWDFFGYTKPVAPFFEKTYISKEGEQMKFLYELYLSLVQGSVEFTRYDQKTKFESE